MTTKKLLAGHSLTYRNVVMLATPGDVGHGWGCRGNSNGGAPRGCPEVDGCYSVWFQFLWRFPRPKQMCFFSDCFKKHSIWFDFIQHYPDTVFLYILNYFDSTAMTWFQLTNPTFKADANMPLMCCHVFETSFKGQWKAGLGKGACLDSVAEAGAAINRKRKDEGHVETPI